MRFITGKFRGQKIDIPKSNIRPTMDKVREAVFSMIRDKIANSVVLDLYAGSGSFGLEAISEGAKICHFVDNSFNATRCIKRNLNKFGITNNVKIFESSVLSFINRCDSDYYDIVFVDPPYNAKVISKIVKAISEQNILKSDGVIVAECRMDEDLSKIKDRIVKSKTYGDTKIFLISK